MSNAIVFHPALILILGAFLLPMLRGAARNAMVLLIPLVALALLWRLPEGALWQAQWMGYAIEPLAVDRLSRLFATIFILMAFGGGLYALAQVNRLEVPAAFLYAGAAVGVSLAGDLITVFVFWEMMAVGSVLLLWCGGTRAAYEASLRYAMVHLLGGAILFAGIAGHLVESGDAAFVRMSADSVAQWLILIGFLVNAGAPPLSAWLPDAYPEASWSGTVFLSAFTTKAAVYVLLRGFPGTEMLVWVGLFMVFYGIVYALLENDMRRILAYSIVNQVGFMIVGIGIGTEMALNGAAAHAFTHIIYKALLLMSAGAVLHATARRKCSELGGLFHSMPLTTLCGCVGALAISSFPLTSGFISKSMVTQAATDGQLLTVTLLLTAASAGVFLHAGIKFPWFVFFQKDSGLRPADPPASMRCAMVLFAILCAAIGIWPETLYGMLPHPVEYQAYTAAHVLTQLQLLLFSGLAFFVMLKFLKRTPTVTLDFDWLWRMPLPALARGTGAVLAGTRSRLDRSVLDIVRLLTIRVLRERTSQGLFLRTSPTGSMALWVMVMLLANLALFYAF
jgi:multicomponent Na+:H+ antiporter subunit D